MRPVHKPGPKSKTRRASPKKKPHSDLGDTDTNPSDEENDQSFRSPPREENVTDYGLDFTTSPRRVLRASRTSVAPAPASTSLGSARPRLVAARDQDDTLRHAPSTSRMVSKQKKSRKQKLPARKELIRILNSTDFMIPRSCFARVVREIMMSLKTEVTRITAEALEALQVATEKYVENRLEDANLLAIHSRRSTLLLRDLALINYLLGRYDL